MSVFKTTNNIPVVNWRQSSVKQKYVLKQEYFLECFIHDHFKMKS